MMPLWLLYTLRVFILVLLLAITFFDWIQESEYRQSLKAKDRVIDAQRRELAARKVLDYLTEAPKGSTAPSDFPPAARDFDPVLRKGSNNDHR
jgi:hypothetical protein